MKKHVMALTALQRAELCLVARSGQAAARKVLRAKILLKADAYGENATDQEIAEALGVAHLRHRLASLRRAYPFPR